MGQAIVFCGLPTQGRKTSAGVGARLWSEPPACHAAIPGGILSAGRCPQESGHGRPEAHSTGANQEASPTIGVFHEIPRAAGPLQQTPKNDRLRHQTRGTALSSYFLDIPLDHTPAQSPAEPRNSEPALCGTGWRDTVVTRRPQAMPVAGAQASRGAFSGAPSQMKRQG